MSRQSTHKPNHLTHRLIERIFFTGGGTAGSVSPLLAVAAECKQRQPKMEMWFVGTKRGVERALVAGSASDLFVDYLSIPAGKFRRYWDWRNVIDPFILIAAFARSLYLVLRYQPDVVVSAGSYVAPPLVWAAWICGKRIAVHQQDIAVGLTAKLTKPFAALLTKAFQDTKLSGAEWIGNPVRDLTPHTHQLSLDASYPTVFVFGGGTGAQSLNNLVSQQWCEFANVIHLTGKGKTGPDIQHPRYHAFELLTDAMAEAYAKADVVVARAGLATISELAALGKPAVIIPIPNSHQEQNADLLTRHNAALVLDQRALTPATLTKRLRNLMHNPKQQATLSRQISQLLPAGAAAALADRILHL